MSVSESQPGLALVDDRDAARRGRTRARLRALRGADMGHRRRTRAWMSGRGRPI